MNLSADFMFSAAGLYKAGAPLLGLLSLSCAKTFSKIICCHHHDARMATTAEGWSVRDLYPCLLDMTAFQVPLHVDTRLTTEAAKSKHHDQHGKRVDSEGRAV